MLGRLVTWGPRRPFRDHVSSVLWTLKPRIVTRIRKWSHRNQSFSSWPITALCVTRDHLDLSAPCYHVVISDTPITTSLLQRIRLLLGISPFHLVFCLPLRFFPGTGASNIPLSFAFRPFSLRTTLAFSLWYSLSRLLILSHYKLFMRIRMNSITIISERVKHITTGW